MKRLLWVNWSSATAIFYVYYGLSWIYETLALPIFCENLISEKESREAELEKLNKNSLAIDSILSNIYDYIIDEGVTE
jgi:hypothetical protein